MYMLVYFKEDSFFAGRIDHDCSTLQGTPNMVSLSTDYSYHIAALTGLSDNVL